MVHCGSLQWLSLPSCAIPVPKNWQKFCDPITDNFRVINPLLASKIRELQSFYKNSYALHVSREMNARERMKHAVPTLSDAAKAFMEDVRVGRGSYSIMPASVEKEFSRLNDALNRRFGSEVIHRHDFHMMQAIPSEQQVDKERIRELSEDIKFVQDRRKFEIQQLAQTRAITRNVKR